MDLVLTLVAAFLLGSVALLGAAAFFGPGRWYVRLPIAALPPIALVTLGFVVDAMANDRCYDLLEVLGGASQGSFMRLDCLDLFVRVGFGMVLLTDVLSFVALLVRLAAFLGAEPKRGASQVVRGEQP